ncbi:YhcN/YlaJ family sporulation lipoprotein [Rossellomorea marisflavi]|nr:YhcN/YlaJ family sporulation lipoprotein [Rossellomorea marisflavi]UKS67000.1 YhcN/YlaJ family sporulation lipoprotein [Rossellomorea marisflavi]
MYERIKIEEHYTIRRKNDPNQGGLYMNRFILLLLTLTFITACARNTDEAQGERSGNQPITVNDSNIPKRVERKSGQQISEHLVNLSTSIPNVHDATAVVIGKYAFVGIDVGANVERSQVGTIKYSVAEALQEDPYGAQAVIVADPDMYARLKEISKDVQNGRPLQGIFNELSDISGRLMPEVPKSLKDTNPENGPDNPKGDMNKSNDRELKKEQEKQSYDKID